MTQIVFNPTTLNTTVDWDSASIWSPAEVPNGVDDDVTVIPVTSYGNTYDYTIYINNGEAYSIGNLDLKANNLFISGSLSVSGDIDEEPSADIELNSASLSAGSLEIQGQNLQGSGVVDVSGALTVDTKIYGAGLTINAGAVTGGGSLIAIGVGLTVNTSASGFSQLSDGVLTSGDYEALDGAVLALNVGSVPTVDATSILILDGGVVEFYDPTAGAYKPIQDTLTTIASGGLLDIDGAGAAPFGDLTDNGTITLADGADFTSASLTIGEGGKIDGTGTIATPVVNDGVIDADLDYNLSDGESNLIITAPVTGSGHFEIDGAAYPEVGFHSGTLELAGAQSQNVLFPESLGTLILDDPSEFSGQIETGSVLSSEIVAVGSVFTLYSQVEIELKGVDYNAVTSYSYTHNGASGVLTIDTTNGDYSFAFNGNLQASDFTLSAGQQQLSTLPPILDITVAPQYNLLSVETPSNFAGEGVSGVLWRDSNGDVAIWNMDAATGQYTSQTVGNATDDWQIAGAGDFNGGPGDGILWRNANGDVTTWNAGASPESYDGGAMYYVTNDWQIAGVGDFNGDGLSDILWRDANGELDIWSAVPGSTNGSFSAGPEMYVTTDWQIAGIGDFNGSGEDGILWYNTSTGDLDVWNVDPTTGGFVSQDLGAPGAGWSVAGVGDFDNGKNGAESILMRNADGDVEMLTPYASGSGAASGSLGYVTTDWQIKAVGDYNGDGFADILWQNSVSGDVTVWYNNSGQGTFTAKDLGSMDSSWQIAAK